jgi:hypothetical protein
MKPHLFVFVSFWCFHLSLFGQNFPATIEGKGFDSIFQNLKEGFFQGQVSGELRIVNLSGDTVKVSFDKGKALLQIQPDPDEVYDVSRKVYSCSSKNDKTSFTYSTYAHSNAIGLNFKDKDYGFNLIDGDCYSVFKNLDYAYIQTAKQEQLTLCFTGNVELTYPPSHIGPVIIILTGSRLTFVIEKSKQSK